MLTAIKTMGVDQLNAGIRLLNPMRGWVNQGTPHGTLFCFDRRWDLNGPTHVTFQPYLETPLAIVASQYEEDLCDDVPRGYVLRIVLDKPRIREYTDRIEVDFVLRIFYTYGGDEVRFTKVMTPEGFHALQQPPCWTLVVTGKGDASSLRPWICSPNPYRAVSMTDGMIDIIHAL